MKGESVRATSDDWVRGFGVAAPDGRADDGNRTEFERETLLRVAARVAGSNDLEQIIELTAEEALSVVGADTLSISRFDSNAEGAPVSKTLINVGRLASGTRRYPRDEVIEFADFPGSRAVRRLAEEGRPYFNSVEDPSCAPEQRESLRQLGKVADLGVPIEIEGRIWGELWAASETNASQFSSADLRFLEAIAGQLGSAISRAELFSTVSRLAYEDSLTGLANRRAFDERLSRACARFGAEGRGVVLLLCDVDGLKKLNDSIGHAGGDEALKAVAAALVAATADLPGAFVARLAGDEFCVLAEKRQLEEVDGVARAAQHLLRDRADKVTISCGIAQAAAGLASESELMGAADAALYVSKRRGGDRVYVHGSHVEDVGHDLVLPMASEAGIRERAWSAVEKLVDRFDTELVAAPVLDRLELVGSVFTDLGNFAGWSISIIEPGSDATRDLSFGEHRRLAGSLVRHAPGFNQLSEYRLEDYPQTAEVVERGAGTFCAEVSDPDADAAEVALLEEAGMNALLAAVATNHEGTYLIEFVTEDVPAPLEELAVAVRVATSAAVQSTHDAITTPSAVVGHPRALGLPGRLADRLSDTTAEEEVVRAVVEELARAFECEFIHLVALDGETMHIADHQCVNPPPGDWSQPRDAGVIGRAITRQATVIVRDVRREPQFRRTPETEEVLSELVVPVIVDGEVWGAINLESCEPEAFEVEDGKWVETVAAQLAGALYSIQLYTRLDRAYMSTAKALSSALEQADSYTAQHSRATVERASAVGRKLGINGEDLRMLRYAAAFHDIGKVAIPREILDKPEALTADERRMIQQHTLIGERILEPIEFLSPARPIVRSSHERMDGRGYPDGLKGEEIPLGARIVFACDAYDAMTSDRVYRKALPQDRACEELIENAGTQFDPGVVQALTEVLDEERARAPD